MRPYSVKPYNSSCARVHPIGNHDGALSPIVQIGGFNELKNVLFNKIQSGDGDDYSDDSGGQKNNLTNTRFKKPQDQLET